MKKVPAIEVKRCFVVSNLVRTPIGRKRYLGTITQAEFHKRLAAAKKRVAGMNELQLNRLISPNYPRRLRSYNACQWYLHTFKTTELGVWRRAGGLPLAWTRGRLADTAKNVRTALRSDSKMLVQRSRHAIAGILATSAADTQKEPYLLPIAFKTGMGTNGRLGLKSRVKADLDDGCMRSIALAVDGKKTIKVYYGVPLKKRLSKK